MTHQQEMADRIAQLRREKSARERRDVLQEEIANAIGVSVVSYGRYENGRRKVPEEAIQKLAEYFETTAPFIRYGVMGGAGAAEGIRREDVGAARARLQAKKTAEQKAAAEDQPRPKRRPGQR